MAKRRAGGGVHLRNALDLIAEKLHAQRLLKFRRRDDLHDLPAHAERAALKIKIVAGELNVDQPP